MSKKKIIIYIVIALIIFLTIVLFPSKNNKIIETITNEILEEEKPIEENQNFYTFLDTIKNIDELLSMRINSQIKFISVDSDTYNDLLSCSLIGNVEHTEDKFSSSGILSIEMSNLGVDTKFPIYAKNLGTDNYSVMLEIPSAYKKVFAMTDEESFLKIDKTTKEKLTETFGKVNKTYTSSSAEQDENIKITKDSFKSVLTFTESAEDKTSGIYDIDFNQTAIKALYNQISENEDYSNNLLISIFFKNLLKNEKNIENIYRMHGQIAVSKGIATDIYFEIESKTTSMIAFRITLSEINNVKVEDVEYHSNEIKLFDSFMETLISENKMTKKEEKSITIGNIYFTSKDETKKVETFTSDMLNDPINVFINYSRCTPKTNLIIRWFYENQSIQLIENKLNNGEYEDGILKSSITFTDAQSIPKGKYRVEVYIDGQDKCFGQGEFNIE